jgi:xanthine dehydrogenase accessory factor
MSHQLKDLFAVWQQNLGKAWALATIYEVQGHSYRKPGSMVLIAEDGQQLGFLSGGCLEKDIRINAKKCIDLNCVIYKRYDGSDDYDISFQLGCGGTVDIAFQPLTNANQFLDLNSLNSALQRRVSGYYFLELPPAGETGTAYFEEHYFLDDRSKTVRLDSKNYLKIPIKPEPHLMIAGGGPDAKPVLDLAKQLGWLVSIWDSRPAFARPDEFSSADHLLHCSSSKVENFLGEDRVDAAIVMSHNLEMDAEMLKQLVNSDLEYVGLLGPKSRKLEVLKLANLDERKFDFVFSAPAGLDIGGELPESIALSIISECHQVLCRDQDTSSRLSYLKMIQGR